ncbi:MAG: SIS domain-containing protein, partial [Planctomycetes bacterium]|nr:SIS domain-containing protein [Planctomycetota bacterium]
MVDALKEARRHGNRIFIMGNGGSASTASHMVCDLSKSTIQNGLPRLRVIPITDNVPLITAWANDTGYENIFVQQLENQASRGDVVIAISGSGRSENVLRAVRRFRDRPVESGRVWPRNPRRRFGQGPGSVIACREKTGASVRKRSHGAGGETWDNGAGMRHGNYALTEEV